jgi:hypothetical protein
VSDKIFRVTSGVCRHYCRLPLQACSSRLLLDGSTAAPSAMPTKTSAAAPPPALARLRNRPKDPMPPTEIQIRKDIIPTRSNTSARPHHRTTLIRTRTHTSRTHNSSSMRRNTATVGGPASIWHQVSALRTSQASPCPRHTDPRTHRSRCPSRRSRGSSGVL